MFNAKLSWTWRTYFVCLGFFVPLENVPPIWRSHHYRWRTVNFDIYSAFMAIMQWAFFLDCHTYCDMVNPFIMVISNYLWHTLLPNVWQWSCHYLCKRPGIQTPNLPHAWRTLPLVLEKEMLQYCQFNYLYYFAFISILQTSMVPLFSSWMDVPGKKCSKMLWRVLFLNWQS